VSVLEAVGQFEDVRGETLKIEYVKANRVGDHMKLSVVIPARNEAGNIGPTLDELRERLQQDGIPYELLIVNDGSTDATAEEVRARSAVDGGVRLIHNEGPTASAMRCAAVWTRSKAMPSLL
jgi:glycosyltransferase involved in cell wall biosynthesis